MTERVAWPAPPREPGAWVGGSPVGPTGSNRSVSEARWASPVVPTSGGAADGPGLGHAGWTDLPPAPPMLGPGAGVDERVDRAPLWVLVLSVVVLAATVIGAAYLVLSGRDDYPDEWDERVAPLSAWVAEARGLDFEHPVRVNFLSEAEYTAAATTAEPESDLAIAAQDDALAQMRALGFVTGEVDLTESVNTLNDSGTLAFYQPSNGEVYVRGSSLTPALRVTLVHELVHVLQDQHFDLNRSGDDVADPHGTLRAVAEGDAGRIEAKYVADELTDEERASYEEESAASGQDAVDLIRDEVPDGLTAMFTAPYLFGEPFVAFLTADDTHVEVDRALAEPPSSRVLFDPRLWGTPDEADAAVDVVVPPGVEEVESGRLTSPILYLALAARSTPQAALAAVDGVAGERYAAFRDGSRLCTRTTLVGQDDDQTAELEAALKAWAAQSPADVASVSRDANDAVQFQACDPGVEATGPSVRFDDLGLPVVRISLIVELQEVGASEAQSSCVTDAVIPSLTPEDLSAEPSEEVAAALQQRTLAAVESCRGAS